jgi:hypothetical protein
MGAVCAGELPVLGPTHRLGGAAAWLGACLLVHPSPAAEAGGAVVAFLAGPQCDLDCLGTWSRTRRRWSKKRQPIRHHLSKWGATFRAHPVRYRIALLLSIWGKHRDGPAHSIYVVPLAGLVLMLPRLWLPAWPLWLGAAVAVGLLSHIALDLVTKGRTRVTWPWGKPWEGLGIRVGKATEVLAVRPVLGAAVLGFAWLIVRGR